MKEDDWKMAKSSNLCLSWIRGGIAFHVLAPVWLADRFPYLQEWVTFGLAAYRSDRQKYPLD